MRKLLLDFADPPATEAWHAIDDRMKGGVSPRRPAQRSRGACVFESEVPLKRNGGFASVRSSPANRGLPDAQACLIDARADGKTFKLSLLVHDGFHTLNYQAEFSPAGADWQTHRLPLAAFRPTFRGREALGAPPLDAVRIRQVRLMIAARQAGPFALEIRRIGLDRQRIRTRT